MLLSTLTTDEGYAVNGAYSYDFSGYSVAGTADMTGNGLIVIGAPMSNSEYGTAYIIITSTDGSFPNNQTVAPSPLPTSQPSSQPTSSPTPPPTYPPTPYPTKSPTKSPTPPPFWKANGPIIAGVLAPALLGCIPIFFSKQICFYALENWGSLVGEAKNTKRGTFKAAVYSVCKKMYLSDFVDMKTAREEKEKLDEQKAMEVIRETNDIEMSRLDDEVDSDDDIVPPPTGPPRSPSAPTRDRSLSKARIIRIARAAANSASSAGATSGAATAGATAVATAGATAPSSAGSTSSSSTSNPLQSPDVYAVFRIEYANPVLNMMPNDKDHCKALFRVPPLVDTHQPTLDSEKLLISSSHTNWIPDIGVLGPSSMVFLFCRQLIEYAPMLQFYANGLLSASAFNQTIHIPSNVLVTAHLISGHAAAMSLPESLLMNGLLLSTTSSVAFAVRLYSPAMLEVMKNDNSSLSVWKGAIVVGYHFTPLVVYSAVKYYVGSPFGAIDGLNWMLSMTMALQQCSLLDGISPSSSPSVTAADDWVGGGMIMVVDSIAIAYFGYPHFTNFRYQLLSLHVASALLTSLGNVVAVHQMTKAIVRLVSILGVESSEYFPSF